MATQDPTATPAELVAFEVYYDRMYRHILSMVGDPAEAEDLTQETFLRAHLRRNSLRDPNAVVAWLYRIATNLCYDRLRQRSRRAPLETEADLEALEVPDPDGASPQLTVEQVEMSACVQQYLADLPDEYRSVILLQDMHGMTGPEIAARLGLPLTTVKMRLHRARRRLQEALGSGCTFTHDERDVLVCEPKT